MATMNATDTLIKALADIRAHADCNVVSSDKGKGLALARIAEMARQAIAQVTA